MIKIQSRKIERNEICPCGSNLKFKKCHGALNKLSEKKARQILMQQQQGLGNPIVSTLYEGYRIVAVANKVYWSENWKTFHDFLFSYIKNILGSKWGNNEIQKPIEKRHPIMQWFDMLSRHQTNNTIKFGIVQNIVPIGALEAFLHLAYNLYLLAHNQPGDNPSDILQKILIKRLKHQAEFPGAYYEIYVYAVLIKAGFAIELIDQTNGGSTHGECIAICKTSNKKYLVEAKSIRRKNILGVVENFTSKSLGCSIRDQLYKALKKESNYPRIIFIDVNLPKEENLGDLINPPAWIKEANEVTLRAENDLTINRNAPEPAYIFYTNHPAHHHLEMTLSNRGIILPIGFKIDDYGFGKFHTSLITKYHADQKHVDMVNLLQSINIHYDIPSTFEAELPCYVFSEIKANKIKIGSFYSVPNKNGDNVEAELIDATISEQDKLVWGVFRLRYQTGIIVATLPITDDELRDYKKHPDVFFGTIREQSKKIDSTYEKFKWLHNIYSKSSKEKLLEFMRNAQDYNSLQNLTQEELALIYCERMVAYFFKNYG